MTIAVDTSALMSVVLGEQDADVFASALADHSGDLCISAATLVESRIVAEAKQCCEATADLGALLVAVRAETVALDSDQADIATAVWTRFGRGRHPAALNVGDCFSYALARSKDLPLLFKGADFGQTDIASVR